MSSQQEKESLTIKNPQNIKQAVLNCQKRLNEVREMEPAVTKLQIQVCTYIVVMFGYPDSRGYFPT